jgi:serine/threonine-protein kinase
VAVALIVLLVGRLVPKPFPVEPPLTEMPAAMEPPAATQPPATVAPTIAPTVTLTPMPTLTPTPIVIVTQVAKKDGMVQVFVPDGSFQMGSQSGDDNERPVHEVYLLGYWIDQTEVTNAQYRLCVAAGVCSKPLDLNSQVSNLYSSSAYAKHPVVFVDWNQAKAYCTWVGRKLPTEAEWEKAARGPDGFIYPWGNNFDGTVVNYCDKNCWADWGDKSNDDGYATTSPVGTYVGGASPYGALDMAGNAYEWVSDFSSPYSFMYQIDPVGPATGTEHILRGGSWGDDIKHLRTSLRSDEPADLRRDFIGFRCAQ